MEASGWGVATLLREIIAKDVKARGGKGRDLTRRMLYLPALIVAAMLMACAAVVLVASEKAEATFPGKTGKIAYSVFDERTDDAIYTIGPDGGGKTKLTEGYQPSYSPTAKGSPTRRWVEPPLARLSLRAPKALSPVAEWDPPTTPARSSS
jgi:hypothetical protein